MGGGISADTVTATQSSISNNDAGLSGGGIWAEGQVTLINSSVWCNRTALTGQKSH
jgi:predicted outer membrane repeat protein